MDTTELDRVIVANLVDLDATFGRLNELGVKVWRALGEHTADWGKLQGWTVTYDDNDIKISAPDWAEDVYFWFGWAPGDDESGKPGQPSSWLGRIAGVPGGQLCLWFEQRVGARTWKPIAHGAQQEASAHGFRLSDGGHFYKECTLDRAALADAIADDQISDAFGPVDAALSGVHAALPFFAKLLTKSGQV